MYVLEKTHDWEDERDARASSREPQSTPARRLSRESRAPRAPRVTARHRVARATSSRVLDSRRRDALERAQFAGVGARAGRDDATIADSMSSPPALWATPPPRPRRRASCSDAGDEREEEEEEEEEVVFALDERWAARFAATAEARERRRRSRRRRERAREGTGPSTFGRGRGEAVDARRDEYRAKARAAAEAAEALAEARRTRDAAVMEDGEDAREEDARVGLYGKEGVRRVVREEAMVNAAFDAWLDASDARIAWFPCEPIEAGLV